MDKTTIESYINQGMSISAMCKESGAARGTITYWLKKTGLKTVHEKPVRTWTDERFLEAIATCTSVVDVILALGLKTSGNGNYHSVKQAARRLGVTLPNGLSKPLQKGKSFARIPEEEIFVADSLISRATAKRRLLAEGRGNNCEECGQSKLWNGKEMSLVLDYKNGVFNDHRRSNLQFLCPNCNSTLETHCGKKR